LLTENPTRILSSRRHGLGEGALVAAIECVAGSDEFGHRHARGPSWMTRKTSTYLMEPSVRGAEESVGPPIDCVGTERARRTKQRRIAGGEQGNQTTIQLPN
ncbi:MAG: hypothetical protein ACTSWI_06290, partial [Alphaproteobacteria bacterium]